MFVSLRTTTEFRDWFDEEGDIRPAVRYAQAKVFFVTNDEAKRHYQKLAEQFYRHSNSELLFAFVRDAPWAQAPDFVETDFSLNPLQASRTSLPEIERQSLLDSLIVRRDAAVNVSETLDNAFRRKIEPYLPFSRRVTLADPYAGAHILSSAGELPNFLIKLLAGSECHFSIHTCTRKEAASSRAEAQKITERLETFIREFQDFKGTYSIYVYRQDSSKFHNRRLGMAFKNGGVGFILENSLKNLSRGRFAEVSDFKITDFKNFNMHLQGISQGMQLLTELHSSPRG